MNKKVFLMAMATAMVTPAFVTTVDAATDQTKESEYTFKAVPKVLSKVEITKSFPDVKATNSHAEAILILASQKVIDGYPDKTFKPGQNITRQQAVKLINRTFGFEKVRTYKGFSDVTEANGYYEDIVTAYEAGIIDGAKGKFSGGNYITRGQMAKILVEGLGVDVTPKGDNPFVDTKGQWYEGYATVLHELGITTGTTKTTFSPNDHVTRQQFASFLYRSLNMVLGDNATEEKPSEGDKPTEEKPVEKPSHTTVDTPMEEYNEIIKNDPVYDIPQDSFYALERTYQNERFRRLITQEGRNAVAATSLKYTAVGGAIRIEKEGSPYQLYVNLNSKNELNFHINFQSEEIVNLTRELVKIAYPEVNIDAIIEQRATEARLAYEKEKDIPVAEREFQGNAAMEYQAGYEMKVGTNAFLEFFWIEFDKMQ